MYFCVALLMDLFVLYVACLKVFVNCLVNVIKVLRVDGGALLGIPCTFFQIMCVLCL